jgi:hypothetical protein
MTVVIILLIAISIVAIIGVVTSIINTKPKCDHQWEDFDNSVSKCKKCDKTIYLYSNSTGKTNDFA